MKNYEIANEALKRAREWYQGSIRALEDKDGMMKFIHTRWQWNKL
ncbi:hypothetical protein ES703_59462 [subsurface metagenome]